jgi:argininosuccinate lyase
MFRDALRTVRLVAAALEGSTFDEARLRARAAEGWITITELADTLVRDHGLPFRTTHAIAARLIECRRVDPAEPLAGALAAASADVLGTPLQYSEDALQRLLSPEHFVAVRMTHGGPAPQELARALDASREVLEADEAWLRGARGALADARQTLRTRVDAL